VDFPRQIFKKFFKFHEKPISESLAVPRGRTDTQTDVNDEANSRLFANLGTLLQTASTNIPTVHITAQQLNIQATYNKPRLLSAKLLRLDSTNAQRQFSIALFYPISNLNTVSKRLNAINNSLSLGH